MSKITNRTIAEKLDSNLITYNPGLAKLLGGDIPTAVFLGQLLFWWEKGKHSDKIWKTDKEFYEECGLTSKQLRRTRKKLSALGILKIKKEGVPARNFYQIDLEKLEELIGGKDPSSGDQRAQLVLTKGHNKTCPKVTTSSYQRAQLVVTKGNNKWCPKGTTITEITTENTTKNTTERDISQSISNTPIDSLDKNRKRVINNIPQSDSNTTNREVDKESISNTPNREVNKQSISKLTNRLVNEKSVSNPSIDPIAKIPKTELESVWQEFDALISRFGNITNETRIRMAIIALGPEKTRSVLSLAKGMPSLIDAIEVLRSNLPEEVDYAIV